MTPNASPAIGEEKQWSRPPINKEPLRPVAPQLADASPVTWPRSSLKGCFSSSLTTTFASSGLAIHTRAEFLSLFKA